jgi:AraC-like DNA-binding protein/quercetin dioxygenase-like cupin family protein
MTAARTMNLGEYFGDPVRHRTAFGFAFTENRFPPGRVIPRHQHALTHLTCVLSGGFTEAYDHAEFDCQAGSVLVVPRARIHEDRVGPQGAHTLSVEMAPKTMQRIDDSTGLFSEPSILVGPQIASQIERLYHEFHAPDDASLLAIAAITLDLIVAAERRAVRLDSTPRNWMAELLELLHQNPSGDASLSALAQKFEVNEAHMARAFRRRHGSSIGEYVRWLRLEKSKSALARPGLSITEIALECGFYDQAHFSRAFKKQYGLSPAHYRRTWNS